MLKIQSSAAEATRRGKSRAPRLLPHRRRLAACQTRQVDRTWRQNYKCKIQDNKTKAEEQRGRANLQRALWYFASLQGSVLDFARFHTFCTAEWFAHALERHLHKTIRYFFLLRVIFFSQLPPEPRCSVWRRSQHAAEFFLFLLNWKQCQP